MGCFSGRDIQDHSTLSLHFVLYFCSSRMAQPGSGDTLLVVVTSWSRLDRWSARLPEGVCLALHDIQPNYHTSHSTTLK